MHSQLIVQRLAEKLASAEGSNCPYDPSCGFGMGVKKCVAPEPVLKLKLVQIKNEASPTSEKVKPSLFMVGNMDVDWPCATVVEITFSEPEKAE